MTTVPSARRPKISPTTLLRSAVQRCNPDNMENLFLKYGTRAIFWFALIVLGTKGQMLWDKAFPSADQIQADQLQETIDARTGRIDEGVAELRTRIAALDQDAAGSAELQAIVDQIGDLSGQMQDLSTTLPLVADAANDMNMDLMAAKVSQMEHFGVSDIADFTLTPGTSVQLCRRSDSINLAFVNHGSFISVVGSIAGVDYGDSLRPGESFAQTLARGEFWVSYVGQIGGPDSEVYGFNLHCPTDA